MYVIDQAKGQPPVQPNFARRYCLARLKLARIVLANSKPNIGRFNVDKLGIARAQIAQVAAYWFGVAFLVEQLLALVVGRPSAVAPVIPAG
jgi:hypothetical protein